MHFSEYPWQYMFLKLSISRPYQVSCAGCGNVNFMGVSISGDSLYKIVRFMYCSMEICTFLNIHGNTCFKSFPFLGRTRPAVLVVGM